MLDIEGSVLLPAAGTKLNSTMLGTQSKCRIVKHYARPTCGSKADYVGVKSFVAVEIGIEMI